MGGSSATHSVTDTEIQSLCKSIKSSQAEIDQMKAKLSTVKE